jgi:hypothetical protein
MNMADHQMQYRAYRRISAAEMKYMRRTAGTLGHIAKQIRILQRS